MKNLSQPTAIPDPPDNFFFAPGNSYLLRADEIIPEPGQTLTPGWIRIVAGRIAGLGEGEGPVVDGDEAVDLGGLRLFPGFIDAHVHLCLDSGDGSNPGSRAERAASFGLAGLRDGGDKTCRVLEERVGIERGLDLSVTGTALFRPGRYGSFLGTPVADDTEMVRVIDRVAESGADQIKMLASGPVGLNGFGKVGPPQFTFSELALAVKTAKSHKLPVMAHANGPEAVKSCIDAGAASIEHGYFMGRENLARLADTGILWIPTVIPMQVLMERETDEEKKDLIRRIVDGHLEAVNLAETLGVRLATGTDAGCPGVHVGPGFYRENTLFLKAGLKPETVLKAATTEAAGVMGPNTSIGALAVGRRAVVSGYSVSDAMAANLAVPPKWVGRPWSG